MTAGESDWLNKEVETHRALEISVKHVLGLPALLVLGEMQWGLLLVIGGG